MGVARPLFTRVSLGVIVCCAGLLGAQPGWAQGPQNPQIQIPSSAQQRSDTRATKDYGYNGEVSVQVEDETGDPFFSGAAVSLYTRDMNAQQTLRMTADVNGRAKFTTLPVGTYVIEVTAPGYRTAQQQVIITGTEKSNALVVSLVPKEVSGKVKVGGVAASPKAVKESEKALQALQGNRIDVAERYLEQALVIDPNFGDGNYLMGVVLLRKKEFAKARAYLQKSVELSPNHTQALLALGEAEYLVQDYSHSMETLEKFLQAQVNNPQAGTAQKYIDAMRKMLTAANQEETGSVGASSDGTAAGPNQEPGKGGAVALADLPPATELDPITESSWAPPDVDEEKLNLDTASSCQLNEVVGAAGKRMQELVANVNRFTATENLEHIRLSPMGVTTSRESVKYKYVAEIRPEGSNDLAVEEYRTGPSAKQDYPDGIATIGLSSLAMIFHPNLVGRYEFRCDGKGSWNGKETWVVHFEQRSDRNRGMLTYKVGARFAAVSLRGRAWIDAKSDQVLAMESDIVHPLPEIGLKRDHQLIEYGPVSFQKNKMQLWLPKSADWYCSLAGKRFHRRHTFSQFLLFSVDDKQQISNPTVDAPDSVN